MSDKPRKTFGGTTKKYTVQFSAFDPVVPVFLTHTNSLKRARNIFEQIKQEEFELGPAGEWRLMLHEHKGDKDFTVHLTSDGDIYSDEPFVYWVHFPDEDVVDEFNYMDAAWLRWEE